MGCRRCRRRKVNDFSSHCRLTHALVSLVVLLSLAQRLMYDTARAMVLLQESPQPSVALGCILPHRSRALQEAGLSRCVTVVAPQMLLWK